MDAMNTKLQLLNAPWSEYEREIRRQEARRTLSTLVYGLMCFGLGVVLGLLLR